MSDSTDFSACAKGWRRLVQSAVGSDDTFTAAATRSYWPRVSVSVTLPHAPLALLLRVNGAMKWPM